jgi:hypothetical protein
MLEVPQPPTEYTLAVRPAPRLRFLLLLPPPPRLLVLLLLLLLLPPPPPLLPPPLWPAGAQSPPEPETER